MSKNGNKTKEKVEVEKNSSDTEELKKRCQEFEDKYKRALADYQNLEKRIKEDKANWIQMANRELLSRLLPVVDTLILAAKHTQDEGIKVTLRQFLQVLENEGMVRIKTEGEIFDPNKMEAVATSSGKDGVVTEEIRPGFLLNGQLIRVAQVKVGRSQN